jgi:anaerobic selenocysteine-containing dehydrogenase
VARSVCPYSGVGCGQLIFHKDGRLVSIEGDPESPISQGNLCPKGAASYQLLTHSRRETKMKYRAPRAKEEEKVAFRKWARDNYKPFSPIKWYLAPGGARGVRQNQ